LIGETEVTKGLHNAVTDSIIIRSNYPQSFYTYQAATDFITQLNVALGINFTLPTQKHWEWAYKGGEKSLKYTYSGSNVASEVGWDKDNSGGKAHKVSTLMPNELGLYDMYGNLGEWYLYEDNYWRYYWYQTSCFNNINTGKGDVDGIYVNVSNIGVRLKLSF
jgi:formylglycine-generating enzyme required for sulfatase activity